MSIDVRELEPIGNTGLSPDAEIASAVQAVVHGALELVDADAELRRLGREYERPIEQLGRLAVSVGHLRAIALDNAMRTWTASARSASVPVQAVQP